MLRTTAAMILIVSAGFGVARAESWEERLSRQLGRKVSLELLDAPLSESCALISSITGANVILAPKVRTDDPRLTLKITDMEAATALKWFAQLTGTHLQIANQAVFISDAPAKKDAESDRTAVMEFAAERGVMAELPPAGDPLTDRDLLKVALQILEKEQPPVQDFPGPDMELGANGAVFTGAGLGGAKK